MGLMLDGVYRAEDPAPDSRDDGRFRRAESALRNWVTTEGPFKPETGRYHLYAAWNCPWAHRALLGRAVLGLEDTISVSFAAPRRTEEGWVFEPDGPYRDPLLQVQALHEVYARQSPAYTGRITVPVLWDKSTKQIVSNESADILRMLTTVFDPSTWLCPEALRPEIDAWNADIHSGLNNGVYRAGFARTQMAYDEAVKEVFETLDRIEAQLTQTRCLLGDALTEADLRLVPTLMRFDVAYHYAFKCNIRRITDYANLWDYARALFAVPEIARTVRFDIYKQGYFSASELRNPLGIVPAGPVIDWSVPADRQITLVDARA